MVYVTVYTPTKPVLDPSAALMFFIAVTTVLLAAYIANTPFDFLRCVHHAHTHIFASLIKLEQHEGAKMYSI